MKIKNRENQKSLKSKIVKIKNRENQKSLKSKIVKIKSENRRATLKIKNRRATLKSENQKVLFFQHFGQKIKNPHFLKFRRKNQIPTQKSKIKNQKVTKF